MTSLPHEIGKLTNLTTLILTWNYLTSLPPEIGKLTNLTILDLHNNRLTSLPPEIGKLTNLTTLDLNTNELTSLPPEIGKLTNLTTLILNWNHLTSLPPEIGKLTNLTSLDLTWNQLTSLPPEINKLTNLTKLYLTENQLTSLPPEICKLSNLTILDLYGNKLTLLPMEIGELTNLPSLSLFGNQLTSLPPEIGKLTNLTTLNLTGNSLKSLPPEIGKLTNLTTLDLTGNSLKSLPPEIGKLTNLTTLDLTGNLLTSLPPEIGRLSNLTTLYVTENQLTSLPPEIGKLTNLTTLDLTKNQLISLLPEIGELSNLKKLKLDGNILTLLPPEIGKLSKLTTLTLYNNKLTLLPMEIGELSNLTIFDLNRNQLTSLPSEIGKLTNLTKLDLTWNQLTSVPPEIDKLTNLLTLDLHRNQLTSLSPEISNLTNLTKLYLNMNQLTSLPPEIGALSKLTSLDLSENQLTLLPSEIGKLTNLTALNLDRNRLTSLPLEIRNLTNLSVLSLEGNELTSLTPEISNLTNLTTFNLNGNQLTSLPQEIGKLTNLTKLNLKGNQLNSLPSEIGELTNLSKLNLKRNQLTSLPTEIGKLTSLTAFDTEYNPLKQPPKQIIEQGTHAILGYLCEKLQASRRKWVSKLLLVGEGGVGKTSLLRVLHGEKFDPQLSTTHGINVESLELEYPTEAGVIMQLNTWDFGGQEIYHAIHQFFLTPSSLFLLMWNARHGYEQGKLYYWLDTIQARAPDSPVLLVATHIDQRDADLPISEIYSKYPQVIGHYEISNKTEKGIKQLREALTQAAARLPLMGETWPAKWLNAAEFIHSYEEKYITRKAFNEIMMDHGINGNNVKILAKWLHELGEILYYQYDEELNNLVILKPQWVTKYISKVLESEEVIRKSGIFTRAHMHELWNDLTTDMQDHFLCLMERFDLSYRTLENKEISLVVERLPLDPPNYSTQWDKIRESDTCKEISIKFELNTIPAGIPTWFIARSHRFTMYTHWRNGALLTDSPYRRHLGLVQAFPHERYLQLTVLGPTPYNFLALLKDGIEVTLRRFPGLKIERRIPCPGHDGKPCSHEFNYSHLQKAIERDPPVRELQCPVSFNKVSVPELLFGLHWCMQDAILERIDILKTTVVKKQDEILAELCDLRELVQREFTNIFQREQAKIDSHCPNVFILRPHDTTKWKKAVIGQKVDLHLCCQAPGYWHPTKEGGIYQIDDPASWIKATEPYIRKMVGVLKYAVPIAGPWVNSAWLNYEKLFKDDLKFMTELVKKIPDFIQTHEKDFLNKNDNILYSEEAVGAFLRTLRQFLDERDPQQEWGGLNKVLTPEGHYLWLCEHHIIDYEK